MATQSQLRTTAPGVAGAQRGKKKRLLLVMNREEMRRLRAILKPLRAAIDWAVDLDSARVAMDAPTLYDAIVVDDRLAQNGWQDVMNAAGELGVKAPFLVCTNLPRADEFLTQSKKTFIADLLMRPYVDHLVQQRVQHALDTDQTEPYTGATIPSHQ